MDRASWRERTWQVIMHGFNSPVDIIGRDMPRCVLVLWVVGGLWCDKIMCRWDWGFSVCLGMMFILMGTGFDLVVYVGVACWIHIFMYMCTVAQGKLLIMIVAIIYNYIYILWGRLFILRSIYCVRSKHINKCHLRPRQIRTLNSHRPILPSRWNYAKQWHLISYDAKSAANRHSKKSPPRDLSRTHPMFTSHLS